MKNIVVVISIALFFLSCQSSYSQQKSPGELWFEAPELNQNEVVYITLRSIGSLTRWFPETRNTPPYLPTNEYGQLNGYFYGKGSRGYDSPDNWDSNEPISWGLYKIEFHVPSRGFRQSFQLDLRNADWVAKYYPHDTYIEYHPEEPFFTYYKGSDEEDIEMDYYNTIWGWYNREQNQESLLVPFTATNNFSGGQIKINNSSYPTPYSNNWGWTTTHTLQAISPQTVDGQIYSFAQWSDGNTSMNRNLTIDDQHNSYSFTANFTNKPQTPENFVGTTYNNHPKLTWTPNTGSSIVGYLVYRNFNKQGFEHYATVTPKTVSQWIDYAIITNPPNKIITYRIDCYDNNGQHSDPTNTVAYRGEIDLKKEQAVSSENLTLNDLVLLPNYPNPFNPTTTITYQLPEEATVKLAIYAADGSLVTTLVEEREAAGVYSMKWDATAQPSGIYFCRLAAEPVTQAKPFCTTTKLLLLK